MWLHASFRTGYLVPSQLEKEVKTILPYTYDNNTMLVVLAVVIVAIVIVAIRIVVLKKKELKK